MKINQIIVETSTTAGSVATVSRPLGEVQKRPEVKGLNPIANLGKKKGPYANSLTEGAVKQLSMDLKELKDEEFKKKYKMTKQEARKNLSAKPEPVQEADLHEEDKIIAVGKGKKLKTGLHGRDEQPKFRGFTPPFKSEGMYVSDRRGNSVCECGDHSMAPIIAKALNAYATTNESIDIEGAGVVAGGAQYESRLDELSKDTLKSYVKKQPERIKGQQGLARTNPNKAERIVNPEKGDIRRALNKLKDPKYGNAEPSMKEGAKVDRMVKHIEKSEKKLGHSKKEAENIAWATANKRGMLDNKNKKAK